MVQTLSPNRADQAFGVRILPGALRRSQDFLHPERRDPHTNFVAVDAVPIANQVSGRLSIGESLNDLLSRPGGGRVVSHVEVRGVAQPGSAPALGAGALPAELTKCRPSDMDSNPALNTGPRRQLGFPFSPPFVRSI